MKKFLSIILLLVVVICFGVGCNSAISTQGSSTPVTPFVPVYTITYELDGGVNNPLNESNYMVSQEKTLYAPTKSGYTFDGWYLNGQKITKIEKGTTGNLTITARWKSIYSEDDDEVAIKESSGCGGEIFSTVGLLSSSILLSSIFMLKRKNK